MKGFVYEACYLRDILKVKCSLEKPVLPWDAGIEAWDDDCFISPSVSKVVFGEKTGLVTPEMGHSAFLPNGSVIPKIYENKE